MWTGMSAIDSKQVFSASERWRFAAERAGRHTLLIWPPLVVVWMLVVSIRHHAVAFDFMHGYLLGGHAVLAGHSPYPSSSLASFHADNPFVYPPIVAYLAAPFAALPPAVAEALVIALTLAGVVGTLLLVGVRDWRCFMVVFLWSPTYLELQTANATVLLALGLALLWRLRNRTWLAAIVAGALIALKLFLWPVFAWLVLTRRFRTTAGGAVAAAVLFLVPWVGIGLAELTRYPHLLSSLDRMERRDSYTVAALLSDGLSWRTASLIGTAVGVGLLAWAARARRDERLCFVLTIAAALVLSPIVWMHYFILLFVVLGLYTPRFGWTWALPLLLWVAPLVGNGASWQTACALAIVAGTFALAIRAGSQPDRRVATAALEPARG
jgi:hypothetical protein